MSLEGFCRERKEEGKERFYGENEGRERKEGEGGGRRE